MDNNNNIYNNNIDNDNIDNNNSTSSIVSSMIDLVVKTIANDSLQFLISSSSNISELKSRVKESTSENIAENRQRIIYRGQVLDDNCTLMSYGISAGAVLHMVARPENYEELRSPVASPSIESESISNDTNIVSDLLSVLRSRSGISNASTIFEGLNSNSNNNSNNNLEGDGNRNSIANMSLEHTRQGILTINTILSSFRQNEEGILLSPSSTTTSTSNNDNIHINNQRKHYYVGQWVDVKDTVAQWLEATVMALNEDNQTIFIHYNGWPTRWDEWIDMDSPRVAPFRTRTAHSPLLPHLSPAPSVLLNNAPRTGSDDMRLLLPQISQLLHKILPAIDEAANLCNASINDSNIHNYYSRTGNLQENSTISPNMPWSNEASYYERRPSVASELSESEKHLNLLSSELSPIFDRLGRVMTDLSPHLRELQNRSAPVPQPQVFPENTFSSLLRTRPPSPPPENRFRELISTSRTNAGSMGRAGFPGNHLDIHIAILSPSHHVSNSENSISQTVANLAASLQLQGRVNQREPSVEDLRSVSSSEHETLSISTSEHQEGGLISFSENSDFRQLNSTETEIEQTIKRNNNEEDYDYDNDNDNYKAKNDNDNDDNTKDNSKDNENCLLYTSPSPRDRTRSRMPSSA